ncbi:hypothetical protein GW17_00009246, partial [Ensete ventricosum]
IVLKKWLNIRANDSEFSADEGGNDSGLDEDDEEFGGCEGNEGRTARRFQAKINGTSYGSFSSSSPSILELRSPTRDLKLFGFWPVRVCIGTWNVGGQFPPENLDVSEWVDMEEPADIYALGDKCSTLCIVRYPIPWQLKKGRAFDGWSEGAMDFPPTYKYELNSTNYGGHERPQGRKEKSCLITVLSPPFSWLRVEVFCRRKLQKALSLTAAE